MLIEIPDPDVILSVIVAFLIGLVGLFTYYKLRPMVKSKEMIDASQKERLEYYERQLIDMKIRLDSIEIQGLEGKSEDPNLELKQFLKKLAKTEVGKKSNEFKAPDKVMPEEPQNVSRMPNLDRNNATDYVLHLITNKAMTSRDIQKALKRSREHTSRLMKKLFDEGFVERNEKTKPYTYSISDKGLEKLGTAKQSSAAA